MTVTIDPHRRGVGWARFIPLLLVFAGTLVYANSLTGGFVFDDEPHIIRDVSIRSLTPPPPALLRTRRAVARLTLAFNYATEAWRTGETDPAQWDMPVTFHATNLAIHLLAGLALYGLARRTLALPWAPPWIAGAATWLGATVALLWIVHPLQTQAVSYIIQRAESLVGLFYLFALYALVRAAGADDGAGRRPPATGRAALWFAVAAVVSLAAVRLAWDVWLAAAWRSGAAPLTAPASVAALEYAERHHTGLADLAWLATAAGLAAAAPCWVLFARAWGRATAGGRWLTAAALCCVLGLATKEVMVTAPVVVLLFDRAFIAGSFAEAFKRRCRLYAALATTWAVLIVLGLGDVTASDEGRSAGLGMEILTPASYIRSQAGAILHYLRLAVWPYPQSIDYLWPIARAPVEIVLPWLVLAPLALLTLWALWRGPRWGFLGAAFFAVLSPTSLIPIADIAVEHRVYLPLAAVIAGAVVSAHWALCRLAELRGTPRFPLAAGVVVGSLVLLIVAHAGAGYAVVAAPDRGFLSGAAAAVLVALDGAAALAVWRALREPRAENRSARARADTAALLGRVGHVAAPVVLIVAVALGARTIARNRDYADSEALWRSVLDARPRSFRAHNNLGAALYARARRQSAEGDAAAARTSLLEARDHFLRSLGENDGDPDAHMALGMVLADLGEAGPALHAFDEALARGSPEPGNVHFKIGVVYLRQGRLADAAEAFRRSLAANPHESEPHRNLGLVLIALGRPEEARRELEAAVGLNPQSAAAHYNLGTVLHQALHRPDEALESYERSLAIEPDAAPVLRDAAWLMATRPEVRGFDAARMLAMAERAAALTNGRDALSLDTLAAAYARAGRFDAARASARAAQAVAQAAGSRKLAGEIGERLRLYETGRPYAEPIPASSQPAGG